jgi:hypothetical protein
MKSFKQFFEELNNSIPRTLYHCTSVKNIPDIKKSGGLDIKFNKSGISGKKGIYLSDSPYCSADYHRFYNNEKSILIHIDTRKLNYDLFYPDDYELVDYLKQNKTSYKSWEQVPPEKSLEWTNQLQYMGLIPLSAMTKIENPDKYI